MKHYLNTRTDFKEEKIMNMLIKAIKIFAFICLGAYIAVGIECSIDSTIGAGIALSAILAIISLYTDSASL